MIKRIFGLFFKFLPVLVLLLVLGEIIVINELAGMGDEVWDIDSRIEALKEENELLGQKVASASSLTIIEQRAKESGFTEPTSTSYLPLPVDLPIALGQDR